MTPSIKALGAIVILALALGFAREVNAFGVSRIGTGFGKLGEFGKGSGTAPPAGCGTGVINASAGCPLPMLGS